MLKKMFLVGMTFVGLFALAQGQAAPRQTGRPNSHEVPLLVTLLSPISTHTSAAGDSFSASVTSPAGCACIVEGRITKVRKAKGREKAEISFAFETLTLGGKTYPISAELRSVANSKGLEGVDEEGRAIGQSSKKKQIGRVVAGAAIGATIGGFLKGGSGVAQGAALGAGVGSLIAVRFTTTGSDIEFWPGSVFALVASSPRRR